MSQNQSPPEQNDQSRKKFQRFFIGLIIFIIFVLMVFLFTGRGGLA